MATTTDTTTDCADKGVVTISNCGVGAIITVCCDDAGATDGSGAGDSEPSLTDDTPMDSINNSLDPALTGSEGWVGDRLFSARCCREAGTVELVWGIEGEVEIVRDGTTIYTGTAGEFVDNFVVGDSVTYELNGLNGVYKAITLRGADCVTCTDESYLILFAHCASTATETTVYFEWAGDPAYPVTLTDNGVEIYSGSDPGYEQVSPANPPAEHLYVLTDANGKTDEATLNLDECDCDCDYNLVNITTGFQCVQALKDSSSGTVTDKILLPPGTSCLRTVRFGLYIADDCTGYTNATTTYKFPYDHTTVTASDGSERGFKVHNWSIDDSGPVPELTIIWERFDGVGIWGEDGSCKIVGIYVGTCTATPAV